VGQEVPCELKSDAGNEGKSISWGFGEMLTRWLKAPVSRGDPGVLVLRLSKVP